MDYKVSKRGRTYQPGVAISNDLRNLIISNIISLGGDRLTGHFPGAYSEIANTLKISPHTVTKVWKDFCHTHAIESKKRGGDFSSKLTAGDLELIETLKAEKGSISLREIYGLLEDLGDVGGDISLSSISRAIRNKMPSGKKYSRKKISHIARERLTHDNVLYTQLFIDYLKSKDVRTVKFFDEAGIKVPDVGTRLYGHSPVGERCVEVIRKSESPNTTLNMLVSYEGVQFYNLVDGATNTVEFLNFFQEAAVATFMQTLRPVLDVGDTIVMDNLAVHHYEGGEILEDFLFENGIELVFTPVYSPDLNPIEMCFNKVKTALNHDLLELVHSNLKLASACAVESITEMDMHGFYRHTSYLDINEF